MLKLVFQSIFLSFLLSSQHFFFLFFQKRLIVSDHSIRVAYFGFHTLLYFEHWVFLALERYVKAIADVIFKGFFWVFGSLLSFFADVLLRQTEKFRNHLSILLPVYLAPEFWKLEHNNNSTQANFICVHITYVITKSCIP